MQNAEPGKTIFAALAVAAAYMVGVEIGFFFTLEPSAVSLLWPPNAIVLAALLLAPVRMWGWLLLAILPAHLYAQLGSDVPLAMSLAWYTSNLAEALLGAGLIRFILKRTPRFGLIRDLAVFLVCAVIIAPVLTSFLDAAFVAAVGWRYEGDYWQVWKTRLFSNAVASTIIVPLILSAASTSARAYPQLLRKCGGEAVLLFASLAGVTWFVFHHDYAIGQGATYLYAPLPFFVWAAVRLGVGGVAACIGIVALISLVCELQGLGPFSRAPQTDAVLWLQIFLLIAASSLMLLAAALEELKAARAAESLRKERLDLALRAARMGVWDWDLSGDQVRWRWPSQRREITMSISSALSLVHNDDRAALVSMLSRVSAGETNCEVECRFTRRGSVRWIMVKGKSLPERGAAPQRVSGIFMDTTHRRERDAKERSQRSQLAHLSRVAMLGDLSGALAHELRQPLAAMLFNAQTGLLELARPQANIRELKLILEDIVADNARAGEVIGRLRALFVRGAVQTELVDVRECVRAVLALENSDLIERSVAIQLDLGDVPLVNVDPIQLQQILLNLILNACEAMEEIPATKRRLRISSNFEGEQVQIIVRDSGPGVSHPEQIFEPFFSTKTDSLGLGLAICRTMVAAHGGKLWGANDPSGGAIFYVSLPCNRVHTGTHGHRETAR